MLLHACCIQGPRSQLQTTWVGVPKRAVCLRKTKVGPPSDLQTNDSEASWVLLEGLEGLSPSPGEFCLESEGAALLPNAICVQMHQCLVSPFPFCGAVSCLFSVTVLTFGLLVCFDFFFAFPTHFIAIYSNFNKDLLIVESCLCLILA